MLCLICLNLCQEQFQQDYVYEKYNVIFYMRQNIGKSFKYGTLNSSIKLKNIIEVNI